MFFDMYDTQAEEVATIIKDAAAEGEKGDDNASNHSAALRNKVQALKRRGTLRKDQFPNVDTLNAINEA